MTEGGSKIQIFLSFNACLLASGLEASSCIETFLNLRRWGFSPAFRRMSNSRNPSLVVNKCLPHLSLHDSYITAFNGIMIFRNLPWGPDWTNKTKIFSSITLTVSFYTNGSSFHQDSRCTSLIEPQYISFRWQHRPKDPCFLFSFFQEIESGEL